MFQFNWLLRLASETSMKSQYKMLLIEYVGHIGLRSLTDGHLGRHLEYFKTLNDARVASVRFIKYNASTTKSTKEKTLKLSSRSFWFSTGLYIELSGVNNFVYLILTNVPDCKL